MLCTSSSLQWAMTVWMKISELCVCVCVCVCVAERSENKLQDGGGQVPCRVAPICMGAQSVTCCTSPKEQRVQKWLRYEIIQPVSAAKVIFLLYVTLGTVSHTHTGTGWCLGARVTMCVWMYVCIGCKYTWQLKEPWLDGVSSTTPTFDNDTGLTVVFGDSQYVLDLDIAGKYGPWRIFVKTWPTLWMH